MSTVEAVRSTSAEETLQDLYERHADRIFGFCRNRLRSQQEAEDATQTTFLHAFRALQRGTLPISERPGSSRSRRTSASLLIARTEGARLGAGRMERTSSSLRLRSRIGRTVLFGLEEALATIPDRQRDAFVLRELRGLSNPEIAGRIGVSVTAVEMLVFRARRAWPARSTAAQG